MSSRQTALIALIAVWLGMFGTSAASGADVGLCTSPALLTEQLAKEGQHSVITANRVTERSDSIPVNIITMNSTGDGYVLEGNKPYGTPSTKMCVTLKFSSARLYDARKSGISKDVLIGGDFNQSVFVGDRNGTRPMFQAVTPKGIIVTMFGNMSQNIGGMEFSNSRGISQTQSIYKMPHYTQAALAILDPAT